MTYVYYLINYVHSRSFFFLGALAMLITTLPCRSSLLRYLETGSKHSSPGKPSSTKGFRVDVYPVTPRHCTNQLFTKRYNRERV